MKERPMTSGYPSSLSLYIDGEWVGAGGRDVHQVVNPATGEVLADLPLANASDMDRALAAAQKAYPIWRAKTVDERAAILRKAGSLIRERSADIGHLATLEQGKPLKEGIGETIYAAMLFEYYAEEAKRTYGRTLVRPRGQMSRVAYEPLGVVTAFLPWNFPVLNPARKLAPALAAGNAIILKSPEETPATSIAIMQALVDAGLPAGTAQMLFGVPDQVSRHLLGSPIVRKLSFTGSVPVGKHLMKLAADNMIRTTMELGGHAPVLIFDDSDLEKTLDMVVAGKFRNAGQVCVSPTRFYVQDGIYDRFVEGFAARTKKVAVGSGLDDGTQMGPLANPRRPEAVGAMIDNARSVGARVMAGGEAVEGNGGGFFYAPTLLADVPLDAAIMNDEPFGPVALARPFATLDEAIEQANRLPFGLAAYAFTENGRRAMILADAIETGMLGINTLGLSAVDSPFGGVKESGHGHEDGPEGLKAFMATKTVHQM